jgi:acetyltransferase
MDRSQAVLRQSLTAAPVRTRIARPVDAPLIARFYESLSLEARYERFFSHKPQFSGLELQCLSHPDPAQEICVIALTAGGLMRDDDRSSGGEIVVGDARLVANAEPGGTTAEGEIALVVADAWRRHGIGRQLLCGLVAAARAQRYSAMFAYVASVNAGMLTLIHEFSFRATPLAGGASLRLMRKELADASVDAGCLKHAQAVLQTNDAVPAPL